jgi:hypothetical protein
VPRVPGDGGVDIIDHIPDIHGGHRHGCLHCDEFIPSGSAELGDGKHNAGTRPGVLQLRARSININLEQGAA